MWSSPCGGRSATSPFRTRRDLRASVQGFRRDDDHNRRRSQTSGPHGFGVTSVLHTWGSALTHHPHVHMIVGRRHFLERSSWAACRPGFFLPVRVLSRLFRRLFLEKLVAVHAAGRLQFFGAQAKLADAPPSRQYLAPSRKVEWVVYSKRPFGGPEAVLAYLSRYTTASPSPTAACLLATATASHFKYKGLSHRRPSATKNHAAHDRRVHPPLPHSCPAKPASHRIRHYGLFASGVRAQNIARAPRVARRGDPTRTRQARNDADKPEPRVLAASCPCCGGRMIVIETFERGRASRGFSLGELRIDTS